MYLSDFELCNYNYLFQFSIIMADSKYKHILVSMISFNISYHFMFFLIVPRTFRLYEELEKAEHAQLADQSVSYGLNEGKPTIFKWC